MRFDRLFVGFALVAMGALAGCSVLAGDDASNPELAIGDDAEIRAKRNGQVIDAEVDPNTGAARMDLTATLKGRSIADVKALVMNPDLSFWKGIKRPKQLKIGAESMTIEEGTSPLFTSVSTTGDKKVRAYMPFRTSGLKKHDGLNFDLQWTATETSDSFTLTATNPTKVETRLLNVDVVAANKINFKLTAKQTPQGVQLTIHEDVVAPRAKSEAAKLLGIVVASADLIDVTLPPPAGSQ